MWHDLFDVLFLKKFIIRIERCAPYQCINSSSREPNSCVTATTELNTNPSDSILILVNNCCCNRGLSVLLGLFK